MKDIAAVAGLSRQAVYLHFRSRGGLLLGLVHRADERFGIKATFAAARNEVDPAARLDAVLVAWFDFVRRIQPVAHDLVRLRETDPDAAAAWEDRMAELRSGLRSVVRSLHVDGALAPEWSASVAGDVLWATTSVQAYGLLTRDLGWSHTKASKHLRLAAARALLV